MAQDQATDIDVPKHRQGDHVKTSKLEDVEFSPGVYLLCDVASNKKARPIFPKINPKTIMQMYHQMTNHGKQKTIRRIADRYYWLEM